MGIRSSSSTSSPATIAAYEPQMRYFLAPLTDAVAYNARGYPPSDVPERSAK